MYVRHLQPITLGIRRFQARIGEALRAVRAGRRIVLTSRGRPVAEVVPPGARTRPRTTEERALMRLVEEGRLLPGTGRPAPPRRVSALGAGLSAEIQRGRSRLDARR